MGLLTLESAGPGLGGLQECAFLWPGPLQRNRFLRLLSQPQDGGALGDIAPHAEGVGRGAQLARRKGLLPAGV